MYTSLEDISFTCVTEDSIIALWFLNGILLEHGFEGIFIIEKSQVNHDVLAISSAVSLRYNGSNITCEATFSNSQGRNTTQLLVQGMWLLY